MFEQVRKYPAIGFNGVAVITLIMAVIPAIMWMQSTGDLSVYIDYETPPGQVYYILSKLMGMYGIFLLWLQVIFTLVKRSSIGEKMPYWSITFHRNLGIITFSCLLVHAALFMTAVSIRKGHFAFGALIPKFDHGFYTSAVSLGVLALYGLVLVVIAGFVRKRGIQKAKWLHRVSVVALILTLIHCLLIGTETRYFTMLAVYAFMITTLITALYWFYKNRGFGTTIPGVKS